MAFDREGAEHATVDSARSAPAAATPGKSTMVDGEHDEHGAHDHDDDHAYEERPLEAGSGSSAVGSVRFSEDPTLVAIAEGKQTLAAGASGIAVTKIQQALVDLGELPHDKVTGKLDGTTAACLKKFQTSKSISPSGIVDQATMNALDVAFTGHKAEGALLKGVKPNTMPTKGKPYKVGSAPKELLDGTHVPTDAERDAFNAAISTEKPSSGKNAPKFVEDLGGGKVYGPRIEKAVNAILDKQLVWATDMEKDRTAGHLYDWGDIEKVAVHSKDAADASFGAYATGKPLKATGVDAKIKDAWEHKEKLMKADPAEADSAAVWRVDKILDGHATISKIDAEHGAVQSRAKEKAIVEKIRDGIVAARKKDLVLIHKAWPAFASGGDVFLQRIKNVDATGKHDKAEGRDYMWKTFQTIIHEYIHTLEHPEHVKYRNGMTQQKGNFTLREGTTDYFTKIAYNNTDRTNATLRKNVEGPFHEVGVTHATPELHTYRQSENAERAAGIVGLKNMCGAFFLGHVELIGKQ